MSPTAAITDRMLEATNTSRQALSTQWTIKPEPPKPPHLGESSNACQEPGEAPLTLH